MFFNWRRIVQQRNKSKLRWTLDKKISGLATVLLVLLGGVSSYFYFEINEISREIEEIGQSDFPLYETATQLILYQKEKQLLLEQLNYIYHHVAEEQGLYLAEIASKFERVEQDISRTLSKGIKQSQLALEEEQEKEDRIRLNQEKEDYQQLKAIFWQLELENQQFNLIIAQFFQPAISHQTSPSLNLIQQARLELQVFEQLTQEILQRLESHINGSVSATVEERTLAVKTNALIAFGALLLGLLLSTLVTRQITASINKVTEQAKFIADNIEGERLKSEALVIDTNDEIRDLSVAFNRMVENFLSSQAKRKQMAEQMLSEKKMAQWQANHDVMMLILSNLFEKN